ncbi:MFS transporter [Limimaricola pyoseonensis]|uniref:Predicted arabinose efflux permease, MFS family n=1 Tax=Limimaricola pyoseonensis TaxID=521013 RepID=A0A1G6ZUP2_9RHOB|nr:MFS transporter [Limimaricola pyoseonensis]SDE06504.1 Predicted arabinose efflux permease, MFS family [Limimaricola pyoseonensis]
MTTAPIPDDRRAKRNTAVLVAAQAVLGAQMPILFVIGGLVGAMLSPNPCLATLPISLMVFGSMTTAPWLSPLMQRHGRRTGFVIGGLAGAAGAGIAALGLLEGSFLLVLLGSYVSGIYMSSQGFFRFAAADSASDAFRPKAISWVMAGGLASALIGPQLNKLVLDAHPIPFLGSYAAIVALNLGGLLLFLLLDLPKGGATDPQVAPAASRRKRDMLRQPTIAVAIICGMVSYALMNLVMTSTPLAVVGCGFGRDEANDIVSAHVLAMFAPSFITGHLIARFGASRIVGTGLMLLGCAGLIGLSGTDLSQFYGTLILLGLGWNFGFIGATAMLTAAHRPEERGVAQGLNDMMVFGFVTVASLASGGLMNCSGGSAEQGWSAVNLAMIPALILAAGALAWLKIDQRRASVTSA